MKSILVCLLLFSFQVGTASCVSPEDSLILESFWKYAEEKNLEGLSVDKRIEEIGKFFLGTPYKAGTLNMQSAELPSVNLRELDCVIFVEVVLALAFIDKYDREGIDKFVDYIIKFRYRNGEITDYSSRLHYSSDWLFEMDKAGYLQDVTQKVGGEKLKLRVSYMTDHPEKYIPLSRDLRMRYKIGEVERAINTRIYYYIPQEKIYKNSHKIRSGDIVLLTTNIKGLDTSHVGIAVKKEGKTYLMHASLKEKKVVISEVPLDEYVVGSKSQTGIMLGRAMNYTGLIGI